MFKFLIFTCWFLTSQFCYAQERSDLNRSNHDVTYLGDQELLIEIVTSGRKKYKYLFGETKDYCYQKFQSIGTLIINDHHYLVIQMSADVGPSCRGIFNIIFVKDKEVVGYYHSDVIFAKKTEEHILYCEDESGMEYVIDFKKGFPKELEIEQLSNIEFRKPAKTNTND